MLGVRVVLLVFAVPFASGCVPEAPAVASTSEAASAAAEPIEAKVRVRVEPARATPLADAVELTGIAEPFASVVVAAETAARVTDRAVERGARVEAGALLFELDGSQAWIQFKRAQASVEARASDRAQAERDRKRSATMHAREGISAAAYERSVHGSESAAAAEELARLSKRAAARGLRDAKIKAPFAGVIAELHAEVGDFVRPGTPVATVVDLSRMRLRVGLTAAELNLVTIGEACVVEFADLGGVKLPAELRSVSPLADPRTGTYAAELWLDNPQERLRQGMIGRVELDVDARKRSDDLLTIPRASVIRRAGGYAVWVVEHHRVEARALTLGRASAERVAVLAGLAPGERVVIEGMFALREGAAVVIEAAP